MGACYVTSLTPGAESTCPIGILTERHGTRILGMAEPLPTFKDVYEFKNLYDAHMKARRGKRNRREVIDFELNLGYNLAELSQLLKDGTYHLQPYTRFVVTDPKRRVVHALCYRDRVIQHSLCDNVVGTIIDPRLIYDNAACRKNKGAHFALNRLEGFLGSYYKDYGNQGYFLKCDIRHYFASINHCVLQDKLLRCPFDVRTREFLGSIINSYQEDPNKGLPLGNQTSQWFALYYLDSLDRLIKERLQIKGYVRYMDDCILIHHDKYILTQCLRAMRWHITALGLEFNNKTQIAPLKNGIDFLGWHFYLTNTGKVIRKLRQSAKHRIKRKLKQLEHAEPQYAAMVRTSIKHT